MIKNKDKYITKFKTHNYNKTMNKFKKTTNKQKN